MSTTVFVAVTVVLSLQVDAASAVDDNGGSSESDIISLIRLNDMEHIKEELKDVKDMTKDLRDARTACAANQSIYISSGDMSSLEEEMRQMKEELKDLREITEELKLTREELNCMKNASASNLQQPNTSTFDEEMRQVKD